MKVYECSICGNLYDEKTAGRSFDELAADWQCPVCGAPHGSFSCPADAAPQAPSPDGIIYECGVCGNTYNEAAAGRSFGELGGDWECSVCGAPKAAFSCPADVSSDTLNITHPAENTVPEPSLSAGNIPEPGIYTCGICGNTYDEDREGCTFDALENSWQCPVCGAPREMFSCPSPQMADSAAASEKAPANPLDYPRDYARSGDELETKMAMIHEMAVSGSSIIEPMRTRLPLISWDDVYFLGAQLQPFPLEEGADVDTKTVIGKNAAQLMEIGMPVYISHMSFGALSREIKTALARGSAMAQTAICSGEGGILPDELDAAHKYIFEYVPNQYSVTDENLKKVDAIEIKIGQGTKPGMGGHLPGSKVTEEIAAVRGKPQGEDIISPSRIPGVDNGEDLKNLVDELRRRSEGRPIGIKLAAGHIEYDMDVATYANPDFITIDGRGGATGASPKFLKDAASVPTIFALHRARKFLNEHDLDIDLIITGGLRTSADFVKALAMGADAVAIASSALMAAACQQYRVCHTGNCPTGSMTQDPKLRKNLDVDAAAQRLANFLHATREELITFARVSGHADLRYLSLWDICTANSEISEHTNISHV